MITDTLNYKNSAKQKLELDYYYPNYEKQ